MTWLLASGPSPDCESAVAGGRQRSQNAVRIGDRRRHQDRCFRAGVAEHDPLIAGAFVLVAGRVNADGDVGGLGMNVDVDLGGLPMEAILLIADITDGGAGGFFHRLRGDRSGTPDFAGQDDAVRRAQRLDGDPRMGIGR